jgi:hypothetical protein
MMSEKEVAAIHDGINTILDLVDAYRAALLARGYSPTAAEVMTMEYHRGIVGQVFAQAAAQ